QKITTEHLGTPFGAGYGDQGRYSLAELPRSEAMAAPAATTVHFRQQSVIAAANGRPATSLGATAGACFIAFHGDGRPDLFLVSAVAEGTSRLLHNLGDGQFEDVTQSAGLNLSGAGLGCAAGDFDNDGHTDLAICLGDGVHLLRNKGDGKFEDVTQ